VILVDDDPVVANILSAQLTAAGYRVAVESTAAGAIETLASIGDGVDLVFCDLMMKGVNGMELADTLAARAPGQLPKVVFMTGGAFTPRARAFTDRHSAQCVDKPFDVVGEAARRLRPRPPG
jgi:CheY-like chemotaxis protein